jgi:hypothetical protein
MSLTQIILRKGKVALRHIQIGMAHLTLQGKDVSVVPEEHQGMGMSQVVWGDVEVQLFGIDIP